MQSQLFLLPFAGGTSYSYQFLKPYLKKFDIVFLELPGRGRRIDEPIIKDFNLAAQDICLQIREKLSGGEFGIYGHSLGAYLALKVSNLLENKHIFPSHIVVSGNPGPRVKKKKGLYLLDNKSFIAEVKKLGGLSDEVCDNEQLMKYFMPVFRGDFEMAESGILADYEVIKAPIFAMMGSEEEDTAQIANWSNYTLSDFESKIFEGGHFFIYNHPKRISEMISYCLNKSFEIRFRTTFPNI